MKIGTVDTQEKVFIVAEIGNNHEGNFENAQALVRRAAECGVDAVKFQTFKAESLVSPFEQTRFRQLKSFELTYPQFEELSKLTRSLGLHFLSTPFDLESADFLKGIVDAFKIASGDNNFFPLIERVAKSGKPLLISAGLSEFDEMVLTVKFVKKQWRRFHLNSELGILHCVSSYPLQPEEANLRAISFLGQHLKGITIGYSDHTVEIEACVLAVAIGARIIEKHFTLDKNFSAFRDHRLSADPAQMKEMVNRIRQAEKMLGHDEKAVQPCERSLVQVLRRSISAARDLPVGHQIKTTDLTWIRPGVGLPSGQENLLIGKVLRRNVRLGEPLRSTDVD